MSLPTIVAWGLGYSASWDMLATGAVGCPVSYALARASLREEARHAYRPEDLMPIAETPWGIVLGFTMMVTLGRARLSPMIPGLTDHGMDAILKRAAAECACGAYYSALRMPHEIKDLLRMAQVRTPGCGA